MGRNLALIAFAFLMASVLWSGCTGGGTPQAGPAVNETPIITPNQSSNLTQPSAPCSTGSVLERDKCNLALAKGGSGSASCSQIYSVDMRDECLLLFPGPDSSYCDLLAISTNRDSCMFGYAQDTKDISLCLKISSESLGSECRTLLTPACSGEPTEAAQARCLAFLYSDYTRCGDDSCLFDYGVQKNSTDSCGIITNAPRREACKSIATNDDSHCASLPDSLLRDVCYGIAGSYMLSASTCEKAFTESSHQQNCIMDVAYKLGQPEICARSGRQLGADNCFANMSIATANYSICERVQNSLLRPGCFYKFAITYQMPHVCEVLTRDMQIDCIMAIFNSPTLTPDKCPPIVSQDWRDLCYSRNAKLVHDETICESIIDSGTKSNCIRESKII